MQRVLIATRGIGQPDEQSGLMSSAVQLHHFSALPISYDVPKCRLTHCNWATWEQGALDLLSKFLYMFGL